jgi:hypothetical protein
VTGRTRSSSASITALTTNQVLSLSVSPFDLMSDQFFYFVEECLKLVRAGLLGDALSFSVSSSLTSR